MNIALYVFVAAALIVIAFLCYYVLETNNEDSWKDAIRREESRAAKRRQRKQERTDAAIEKIVDGVKWYCAEYNYVIETSDEFEFIARKLVLNIFNTNTVTLYAYGAIIQNNYYQCVVNWDEAYSKYKRSIVQ